MAIYLFLSVCIAWLAAVSWILYKTRRHYQNLIAATKKEKIDEILDELLQKNREFGSEIHDLTKEINKISEHSKVTLQKIGLVRFNPFEKVGGEQSFVLALLNDKNCGIVINFIYTREGVRTYIKKVKDGKSELHELSEEEIEAVQKSSYY